LNENPCKSQTQEELAEQLGIDRETLHELSENSIASSTHAFRC